MSLRHTFSSDSPKILKLARRLLDLPNSAPDNISIPMFLRISSDIISSLIFFDRFLHNTFDRGFQLRHKCLNDPWNIILNGKTERITECLPYISDELFVLTQGCKRCFSDWALTGIRSWYHRLGINSPNVWLSPIVNEIQRLWN